MKGIPSSRRHNIDHITHLFNKAHGSPPPPNFSKRNYSTMLALQAETQRRKAAETQPKREAFKLSRFGSVGSLVFQKKEESKQQTQPRHEPKKRTVSQAPIEQQKVTQDKQAEVVVPRTEPKPATPPVASPAKSTSDKSPGSPIKPGTLAAETNRRLREAEESRSPAGMRLLSSEEQQASLDKLLAEKRSTIIALNKVPLASTTPSIVSLRRELERKLVDLEKSIDVFTRKRVFVKA